MAQTNNDHSTFNSRVWISEGKNFKYAEQVPGVLPENPNTGVCFSGGGTRSLSATMGQLRGLNKLGLIDRIRYISCVSGGSWASTAFTYYNTGSADDDEFLGPVTEPNDITMKGLGELKEGCLGYTATKSLRHVLFEDLENRAREDRAWIDAVGEIFFRQFGLYDRDNPGYFSFNDETVTEIKSRNPSLRNATFHTVRTAAPRPFLVINASLIGPVALSPFKKESVVIFEYTPLYVGNPFALNVTYTPEDGRKAETCLTGGGFVEPFAFGGPAPASAPSGMTVNLPAPARPYSLADASGTSSAAFAGFVEQHHLFGLFSSTCGLSPEAPYWPVTDFSGQPMANFAFGDGGVLENYGLISLLQRRVETIVVFINTPTPLTIDEDPEKLADGKGIDANLPPLFGHKIDSTGRFTANNHVFDRSDFPKVVRGLQEAKKAGRTVMTTTELKVQPNDWWGLEGGQSVRICWVYLDRVRTWEGQLSSEIRKEIERGNHAWLALGPFKKFPNYSTAGENALDLVELTPDQVNLLADLSCWNITKNANTFQDLLS